MRQESKIKFTILGIVMMLSFPIVWAVSFGLTLVSLMFYEFFVVMIGILIVSIFYSVCLAQGLLFLIMGLIETIEQLILSHFYSFLSFSMFKWDILLINGILFMLGALVERKYIRGKKEGEVTWKDVLPPLLFIIALYPLSFMLLFW